MNVNNNANFEYVLLACPRGQLGQQIGQYWNTVSSDRDLNHQYLRDYPPHCTLTSFFTRGDLKKDTCKVALDKAVQELAGNYIDITITDLKQGGEENGDFKTKGFHYLQIESRYLRKLTDIYAQEIGLSNSKNKKGIEKPYHVTLANHAFKIHEKTVRILQMENVLFKKIAATGTRERGEWAVCLYRREIGKTTLELRYEKIVK